jgi:PIN domain nuclease of toxin-antitoxin system
MIALDTHVWLWWLHDPRQLSIAAVRAIEAEAENGTMLVSAISVWEVATKVGLGKLALPLELDAWFEKARVYPGIRIDPVSAEVAIDSTRLPEPFHRDPADRIIVATARRHGIPLVTCDSKILDYPHVQTVW